MLIPDALSLGGRNHTGCVTLGGQRRSAEKMILITWLPLPQLSEVYSTKDLLGDKIIDNNMCEDL